MPAVVIMVGCSGVGRLCILAALILASGAQLVSDLAARPGPAALAPVTVLFALVASPPEPWNS